MKHPAVLLVFRGDEELRVSALQDTEAEENGSLRIRLNDEKAVKMASWIDCCEKEP